MITRVSPASRCQAPRALAVGLNQCVWRRSTNKARALCRSFVVLGCVGYGGAAGRRLYPGRHHPGRCGRERAGVREGVAVSPPWRVDCRPRKESPGSDAGAFCLGEQRLSIVYSRFRVTMGADRSGRSPLAGAAVTRQSSLFPGPLDAVEVSSAVQIVSYRALVLQCLQLVQIDIHDQRHFGVRRGLGHDRIVRKCKIRR